MHRLPVSAAVPSPFQPGGSSERTDGGPGVGAAWEDDQPGARGSVFDSDEPVLAQPGELALLQEPLLRTLAHQVVSAPAAAPAAVVDQIALQLVRRFQVGGNGRASAVRLEFGEGRLQGGSVLVSSEDGQLSIEVDAPPGVDVTGLAERLKRRLQGRGLSVASLECS